mgnify:FL=1|jgi:hypothetical protein
MNFTKAQKEIVNELLRGRRVSGFNIDEKTVLVSPDGYKAYIFPVASVIFSLDKIKNITPIPVAEIVKDENELRLTPDFRLLDSFRNKMVRRLKGNGKNVFVNMKFLECFQNPQFFQEENKLSTIVVTEKSNGKNIPVGIVLPVRCTWDDSSYYGDMEGA